ncbi:hypothetical protein RHGRI_006796 [Rhododendron griersonianum]|uniref:t-SNARE coiled-coil homology domain-containing protein n=1 Tax=Rhododendron griersonianum TaxID=479676 RepID=A0AAV6KUX4_9ERIC|nr:hypothetical protein RHGRI_006796 [Rhododendron griersonianum]
MNDLLSGSFEIPRGQPTGGDLEMGTQRPMNSGELGLDNFFKQVQEIEKQYEKLNKLLKKLQDAHEESKAVTKAAAMKAIKQRMEKDVDEVGKVARSIKSKIEELDRENLANRQKPGCGKGSGVDRSRTATTVTYIARRRGWIWTRSRLQTASSQSRQSWNFGMLGKKSCTRICSMAAIEAARGRRDEEEAVKRGRRRRSTEIALKKKFKDKMSEFQTLRESIHQEYREVVERRVYTANHFSFLVAMMSVTGTRADEETIDHLIETGDSEQIFQKAIREQGRGQIMDTLAEIQERHDAVREVERKLLELQQIFMDMAVLVDAQGDLLDNIESQVKWIFFLLRMQPYLHNKIVVSSAVDHVQSGNTALQKAKKLQRNSRKWMCIAILILLIIIAIVVVGVIKPWQSNKGA